MRSNLCRQPGSDFYPLNPDFRQTPCGLWWRKCLKKLLGELSSETLAKKMLVVEWFPYHSKNGKALPKKTLPSQLYSFQLAKEMIERKKLIVGMRAKERWQVVDSRFSEVPFLKNPQCCSISRGNTAGDLFDQIVEALR
jgi:hypothetical protein